MWHLIALLAPGVAAVPFDLRTALPPAEPDEIIVNGQREADLRYRLDPALGKRDDDMRLSADLGFGKLTPDVEQGRLGDTRVVIRLRVPF